MSRDIDPRFPPKQFNAGSNRCRWVVIGNLPKDARRTFWKKCQEIAPEIVNMRREGGQLFGCFNAVFQIPESRYKQIMSTK